MMTPTEITHIQNLVASKGWKILTLCLQRDIATIDAYILNGDCKDKLAYDTMCAKRQSIVDLLEYPERMLSELNPMRPLTFDIEGTEDTKEQG